MKWLYSGLIAASLLAPSLTVRAATRFVAISSTNPVAPYVTWETAATNIQDAIDVSVSNDTVLVSNGVYATGGRTVHGWAQTNRVAITNAITVRSVNGPALTSIRGKRPPGDPNVRCAYVGSNAVLSGFALTNGATIGLGDITHNRHGGGAWCEPSGMLSNCVLSWNGAYNGGGSFGGVLVQCILDGNQALNGGGACESVLSNCTLSANLAGFGGGGSAGGLLYNCVLTGNVAAVGGGSYSGTLHDCSVANNTADYFAEGGGGAAYSVLEGCTVSGNTATNNPGSCGGGTYYCSITRCVVSGNRTLGFGGGCYGGTISNSVLSANTSGSSAGAALARLSGCLILGNAASVNQGGAGNCQLEQCTVVSNTAANSAGGAGASLLRNCIVYFNEAPDSPNHDSLYAPELDYCCTVPVPPYGTGNISNDPQFVDAAAGNLRLKATSPCIDRGDNAYAAGAMVDLDGNPRIAYGVVDLGAYEAQFPVGYWVWAAAITNGWTNLTDRATGDGYANLLKYATGSSATHSDELAAVAGQAGNGVLALRFNRNTNAGDATLIVEGSDAATNDAPWIGIATNILGSWGGATNVVESGTGTPVVVLVQDTRPQNPPGPGDAAPSRFLRLRITRP